MEATHKGAILGTPRYMSPEQASGQQVDARSDLYSLACILYEMLAGQTPFEANTADAMFRLHREAVPQPVTVSRPTVPPAIATAIARALAKIPADRFESAARFAEALSTGAISGATPTPESEGPEEATPNNLPKQRTHFIGRKRELAECARILGETRLLTLTGVGGSGKTRLALKLADSVLDTSPDGVWFVDLAPLPDPDRVPQAVAKALNVAEIPGRPILDTLLQHVAPKQTILVLDNCEHLFSATAEIADQLLAACDKLRIIATSREGLGVEGESTYSLRSLSVPKRGEEGDLRKIEETDSVSLFVDRARAVDARFRFSARGGACRRRDLPAPGRDAAGHRAGRRAHQASLRR
jgi:non-specific serine/threonine protein kinase